MGKTCVLLYSLLQLSGGQDSSREGFCLWMAGSRLFRALCGTGGSKVRLVLGVFSSRMCRKNAVGKANSLTRSPRCG